MKLCIIGPAKRTTSDLQLLLTAKMNFPSVLYVPYSNIFFSVKDSTKINYKNIDLKKFDIVFPRMPKDKSQLAFLLLNSLNAYSPFSPESFLITGDRFIMMDTLRKMSLPVPELYFIDSVKTAAGLIDNGLKFPVTMRISGADKTVTVVGTNKEAKTVLDTLKTFRKPVYIEEMFDKSYYQAYVVGHNVIAALERKPNEKSDIIFGKGKAKKINLSQEMESLAINAAKAVKSDIALITMTKNPKKTVFDINLNPPFIEASRISDVKIDEKIIIYTKAIYKMTEKPELSRIKKFVSEATALKKGK